MNPQLLVVLLHLGGVFQTLKDIEHGIADVVAGKASAQDAKLILQDIASLLTAGVITIPGITQVQLAAAIQDLQKVV